MNLDIYNSVREVPKEALKQIQAGRLKGMSDINPMWRIKSLTEQFGVCGVGWKYKIISQILETGGKDEISAFVTIELFIKIDGEWSDGIPGVGGSSYVASEKNGLHTSDECFKMALTDAISVSCKALGFGADVYWSKDNTKYDKPPTEEEKNIKETEEFNKKKIDANKVKTIKSLLEKSKGSKEVFLKYANVKNIEDIVNANFTSLTGALQRSVDKLEIKKDELGDF